MKRLTALAAGAVLAVTLTGCMRVQTDIVLHDDDTMDVQMVMAVEDAAIEELGMTSDDFLEQMETETGDDFLAPGTQSESYKQDGYTGYLYSVDDAKLEDFSDEALSFTRDGDEYVVSGTLESSDTGLTDDDLANMESLGMGDPDITFSVEFPGEVTESNGEIDGNTVTWTYVLGEPLEFDARGSAGGSGSVVDPSDDATDDATDPSTESTPDSSDSSSDEPEADSSSSDDEGVNWLLWVGIGVGVLALAGLATWLILRNRRGGGQGGPGGPGAYAAAGAPAWGQQQGQPGQQQWGQQPQQPGQQGQQWGQPQQPAQPGQQQWGQPGQGQQQPGQPGQQWGQPDQQQGQQGQPGQQQWGQPGQGQPQQPGQQQWGQQPGQPGQPGQDQTGQQWGQPGKPGEEPPAPGQQPWR